jgi:hypothetical protein
VRGDLGDVDAAPRGLAERPVVGVAVEPPQPLIGQVRQLRPVFDADQVQQAEHDVGV